MSANVRRTGLAIFAIALFALSVRGADRRHDSVGAFELRDESSLHAPEPAGRQQRWREGQQPAPKPLPIPVRNHALQVNKLPASLSDSAFWALSASLSEPDGMFHSENFVSNEGTFQTMIPFLVATVVPGGVYMGVGPEQNFSYIAALKPRMAFIVDIRRQNLVQHLMYKAIFELSPRREDFFARLFSRPKPAGLDVNATTQELFEAFSLERASEDRYRANLADIKRLLVNEHKFGLRMDDIEKLEHVYRQFFVAGPGIRYTTPLDGPSGGNYITMQQVLTTPDVSGINRSFLATEESYGAVRSMHQANLIVPVVGDFAGPSAIRAVGAYVAKHEARISAFYVSNVESYLFRDDAVWPRFYGNVSQLPLDTTSVFIRPQSGSMMLHGSRYVETIRYVDSTGKVYTIQARSPSGDTPRTMISSISESGVANMLRTLKAVSDGRIRGYQDVFRIGPN